MATAETERETASHSGGPTAIDERATTEIEHATAENVESTATAENVESTATMERQRPTASLSGGEEVAGQV